MARPELPERGQASGIIAESSVGRPRATVLPMATPKSRPRQIGTANMAAAPDPYPPEQTTGPWSPNTKLLASLVFLVLVGLSLWRFKHLLQPLVISVVIAYLLHPVVTRLARLPFLSRAMASVVVFAAFGLISGYTFLWLGSAALAQLELLRQGMPQMVADAQAALRAAVEFSPWLQALLARPEFQGISTLWNESVALNVDGTWDIATIVNQSSATFDPILRQSRMMATNLARGTFNTLATAVLIVVLSLYMIIDIPRVEGYIGGMAPIRSVQNEMKMLWRRFSQIWEAYLRGQINIALLMFIVVSALLSLLGVKNAVGLGLLAGAMEFLPLIGPVISVAVAVLATFFQGSTIFALSTLNYTLLVAAALLVVNLLESNVLVPRILGRELRLHPLVVLVSVLMGTSLAGILGAVLAAPVAATLKLVGTYAWYRVLDQPPDFLVREVEAAARLRPSRGQVLRGLFQKRRRPPETAQATDTDTDAPTPRPKGAAAAEASKVQEE